MKTWLNNIRKRQLELASESFDADNQEDSDGQITLGI